MTTGEKRITSKLGEQISVLTPERRKRLAEMIDTLLMVESAYACAKEQKEREENSNENQKAD